MSTEETWDVRAYASWTVVPLSLRDDQPAMEAFLRTRFAQLRNDAMAAGHILLPETRDVAQVTEVYIPTPEEIETGDDTVMIGWFGEGPTYRHNALRVLTEIRVAYNPAVAARELEETLARRDAEDAPAPVTYPPALVAGIGLLCFTATLLVGLGIIFTGAGNDHDGVTLLVSGLGTYLLAFVLYRLRKDPR